MGNAGVRARRLVPGLNALKGMAAAKAANSAELEELAATKGKRRMNDNDLRQCEGESLPGYLDRLKQIQAELPPPHRAVAAIAVSMAMRRANARLNAERNPEEQSAPRPRCSCFTERGREANRRSGPSF